MNESSDPVVRSVVTKMNALVPPQGPEHSDHAVSDHGGHKVGTLLMLFGVGLLTILAIGLAFSLLGAVFSIAFGVASFLLLKVAPVVFLGWVVLKLIDRRRARASIPAADRAWLEGGR